MTHRRDPDGSQELGARLGEAWRAARRREGLGTMLAVVVLSTLIIVGLSYVLAPPPPAGIDPTTPPATYRAQ